MRTTFIRAGLAATCSPVGAVGGSTSDVLAEVVQRHKVECAEPAAFFGSGKLAGDDWQPATEADPFPTQRIAAWEFYDGEESLKAFVAEVQGQQIVQEVGFYADPDGQEKIFCLTAAPDLHWMPDIEQLVLLVGSEPDFAEISSKFGEDRDKDYATQAIIQWSEDPFQGDFVSASYNSSLIGRANANKMPAGLLYAGFYIVTEASID